MKKGLLIFLFVVGIFVVLFLFAKTILNKNYGEEIKTSDLESNLLEEVIPPMELSLPFKIEDINSVKGVVNPLGVVRSGKDQSDIGHSGIDIPLEKGSPIYAVADGPVVLIGSVEDPWNGSKISQLLEKTKNGEGWAFNYEHIKIADGISEGTELKRGEIVGTKIAPEGFTLHLQLSKVFNDYKYTKGAECWVDSLNEDDKNAFSFWWSDYSRSEHLIDSWGSIVEEEKHPFKSLLDKTKYPNGPKLCYELGTDVR